MPENGSSDTKRHTIICLSSQRWDDTMWTNKQHIMSRLAKNHRVIHVDYGLRPLPQYLWERLTKNPGELRHPLRLFIDGVSQRDESLYVGDAFSPLIAGLFSHGNPLRDFSTFDLKLIMLKRFLQREGIEDPIVWVYHPGFGDCLDWIPRKLLVYDCVDNYSAFPTYHKHADWINEREERLCRKADLVFTTSNALYESRRPFNPDNTHLVHNVGDAEHFKTALLEDTPVASEVAELDGPIIGFVGAVSDYKLNAEWILSLAQNRPRWQIVLVGPVGMADPNTDVGALKRQKNVHLLGHRDYKDLPKYLKGFDVAVIPYRINSYTESVFPIKFFEFLATGKPVVISNLPALKDFYDIAYVARDAKEFIQACEDALNESSEKIQMQRIALAEKHSWPARINAMMGHIEAKLQSAEN